MATTTQITLAEYLNTTYRPDQEYVDGELRERHVGETDHARVQALLVLALGAHELDWKIIVTSEHRMRVSQERVRIPDVTLVRPGALSEDVLSAPPLCVIEIVSPEDTWSATYDKAHDYRRMGIENIWLIDPQTRSGQASTADGWRETVEFAIPGTPIRLSLNELFLKLDQSRTT